MLIAGLAVFLGIVLMTVGVSLWVHLAAGAAILGLALFVVGILFGTE